MKKVDYYEFLQISPNAEQETIHRVYRFLGARYHPDNPESGDTEKFSLLKAAYEVLSDPMRRAEYDAMLRMETPQHSPMSDSVDFMDDVEGEMNRRLAVMAVLYFRRRSNPGSPEVSLADLEVRMGFPRDYLDFTTWYLKKKDYVTMGDNASFSLTVQGVDFVETQRIHIPTLNKLLTSGNDTHATGPIQLPDATPHAERRLKAGDRRMNAKDRRQKIDLNPAVERRTGKGDRRSGLDRRAKA